MKELLPPYLECLIGRIEWEFGKIQLVLSPLHSFHSPFSIPLSPLIFVA